MKEMASTQDFRPKYVTQQEANEMVELWGRLQEGRASHLLTLEDLCETLQISEKEAEQLLKTVRSHPEPPVAVTRDESAAHLRTLAVMGGVAIVASVFVALMFIVMTLVAVDHGFYVAPEERFGCFFSLVWVIGWIYYFRRPIQRFIRFILRGQP